jgi:hypothetical protein
VGLPVKDKPPGKTRQSFVRFISKKEAGLRKVIRRRPDSAYPVGSAHRIPTAA